MSSLSGVERNALLVLAAMGGTASESACLKAQFQVNLSRAHRDHLRQLGLVTVSGKRRFELALTPDGRRAAGEALAGLRAEGLERLSDLLVLRLLARLGEEWTTDTAKEASPAPEEACAISPAEVDLPVAGEAEASPSDPPVGQASVDAPGEGFQPDRGVQESGLGLPSLSPDPSAMGEAKPLVSGSDVYDHLVAEGARTESDLALAMALQDMPSFARQIRRLEGGLAGSTDTLGLVRQVDLAAGQVFQSLRQAALRRGLREKHARGDTLVFDAAAYESDLPMQQGESALVLRSAIVRGEGEDERIVLRGRADPC
jgi:hypothetical protein